jgi:hypothetical protein
LFPAAYIAASAPLCALLSIGLAFFFRAVKREYLDQDTLAFVTASRPTKTNNDRRKTAVPFGTTRKSSIPSGEVLQMIEISTAQTQGLFPIQEEELTFPNHLGTIRALRVTENLKNNEIFGPSCLALIRLHGSTTYPPVFNMSGVEAPGSFERVLMQTDLRGLWYEFSLACESTILTVCGPVPFKHAGFIPGGDFESAQR